MRIERVEAFPTTFPHEREELSYCFVRVTTEGGAIGWGEACDSFGCSYAGVVAACIEQALAPLALGEDPTMVDRLLAKLRGWTRRRLGDQWLVMQAISAVELACWDLVGKAMGKPVADLLGHHRSQIPIYASSVFLEEGPPEWHLQLLQPLLDRGVTTVKLRLGVDWPRDLRALEALMDLLGDGFDVAVDASECFTLPTALEIGARLAARGVRWLEEPVPQHHRPALDGLADRSPVAVAYGEHLFGLHDFRECLERRQATVVQPDAATCGGIAEARRVAALAALYGARVIPHCAAGPVALAANLHVAASTPGVNLVEYAFPLAAFWHLVAPTTALGPADIVDGMLSAPQEPGLGVALDEDVLTTYPYRPPGRRAELPRRFIGDL